MAEQIPFIGRSVELTAIYQKLTTPGASHVICFVGRGGIGKTRLLEEVYRRFDQKGHIQITGIINFDDRAFHYVENLDRQLIQELGSRAFTDYYLALRKWRSPERDQASPQWIEEQRQLIHQTFISGFNAVSSQSYLVIRFDTLEKMKGAEVEQFLLDLMAQTHNTLFLLAGREEEELGFRDFRERLEKQLAERATFYPLAALVDDDSRAYLIEKQQLLSATIEPELAEKILVLAEGRPILLDLAVEWLARHVPLEWMNEYTLAAIRDLNPTELAQRRQEFEVQLVQHITKIRTPMDQLLLLISRIFPFDRAMVKTFLTLPDADVEELFKDASGSAIIKLLPGGRITLHDEMRRLIHAYVWPEIDSDGQRQKRDSRQAIDYFNRQIEAIQAKIAALATTRPAVDAADPVLEFEQLNQEDVFKYDLLALWEQLLFHTLFTNKDAGVQLFIQLYTQAGEDYVLSLAFREVLLRQTRNYISLAQSKPYLDNLDSGQIYEVLIRWAKYLLDSGRYPEAEAVLNDILGFTSLRPDQEADANIQLANVVIRQGRFLEGIKLFEMAVEISRNKKMPDWRVKAENGLGWAYRLITKRNEARKHYEAALARAEKLDMKQQLALLYNNLGFVYAYIPSERHRAVSYCETALDLWQETNNERGVGAAYSTLGCITFMAGHLGEALNYFQRALNIFEPAQDREWLSTVYSWRGAVYISQEKLDLAEKDLAQALALNVEKDRPMTLSRRALLELKRGQIEQVQQTIEECYQLSHKLRDALYQLVSLRDKARLACHLNKFEQLEPLEKEWAEYRKEWGEPQDRRAHGMLFLNFGLLAFGLEQPEKGLNYLKQGLEHLVELGRYGSDSLGVHVKRMEEAFTTYLQLPPAQISIIGAELQQFWKDKRLKQLYPNVARTFETWADWKGTNHAG